MTERPSPQPARPAIAPAIIEDQKTQRLAAALRDNLLRRKQQQRARSEKANQPNSTKD